MIPAACAGFLIAVLWMDLIFDVQVLRHRVSGALPDDVLASITAYYLRATTTSRPMSLLIAVAMVILLGTLGFHLATEGAPLWSKIGLPALAGFPILLAAVRTVPDAIRLGGGEGSPAERSRLARSICRDHLVCLASMSAFLVIWVAVGKL